MRAECGLPSFEPVGSDMDSLDIFTYSYDDSDIETETYNSTVASGSLFGGQKPISIPLPSKFVRISEDQITQKESKIPVYRGRTYYDYYDFYTMLDDGTYLSSYMNTSSGEFNVKYTKDYSV